MVLVKITAADFSQVHCSVKNCKVHCSHKNGWQIHFHLEYGSLLHSFRYNAAPTATYSAIMHTAVTYTLQPCILQSCTLQLCILKSYALQLNTWQQHNKQRSHIHYRHKHFWFENCNLIYFVIYNTDTAAQYTAVITLKSFILQSSKLQ